MNSLYADDHTLEKATQYLYGKGIVTKDKDIADKLGYDKTTVSSYLNGRTTPSPKFIREFEKHFSIKLADFAPGGKEETVEVPDAIQLLSESILQIKAELQTNRMLLIEVLASTSNRSAMEVQALAENLLSHNLTKISNELKQGF